MDACRMPVIERIARSSASLRRAKSCRRHGTVVPSLVAVRVLLYKFWRAVISKFERRLPCAGASSNTCTSCLHDLIVYGLLLFLRKKAWSPLALVSSLVWNQQTCHLGLGHLGIDRGYLEPCRYLTKHASTGGFIGRDKSPNSGDPHSH
jgi:hypothetical protein